MFLYPYMLMKNFVHLYPHFLCVEIEKPMYHYSNYSIVRLDEKWIKFAIHNFVSIVITTPKGEKVFFPKQIIREGKKVKEEFLIKGVPMTLYEIAIPDGEKSDPDRWKY
jgi:hypothetical protein